MWLVRSTLTIDARRMRRLSLRIVVLVWRGVHHAQIPGVAVVLNRWIAVEAVLMRMLLLVGEQALLLLGLLWVLI